MILLLGRAAHAWLVALDQLAYVTLGTPAFLLGFSTVPSPHETISSAVGRHAKLGFRWALVAERAIDGLFVLLGGRPGHCRRAIVRAALINLPLA